LKTRCSVATDGLRPGGRPSGTRAAGSKTTRSRAHWATAYRLRAPQSMAATATCKIPTRGTGDRSGRQPSGWRGSGTAARAAARGPGGAGGATGNGFGMTGAFQSDQTARHASLPHLAGDEKTLRGIVSVDCD
jgi:hypothetical protein